MKTQIQYMREISISRALKWCITWNSVMFPLHSMIIPVGEIIIRLRNCNWKIGRVSSAPYCTIAYRLWCLSTWDIWWTCNQPNKTTKLKVETIQQNSILQKAIYKRKPHGNYTWQQNDFRILMSAHSLFYSSSTHSSHNYSTRSSLFNLPTPLFTSTAG